MAGITHESMARDLLRDARRANFEKVRRDMLREAQDEANKIEDSERRELMRAEIRRFRHRSETLEDEQ